ncbi:MAG: S41 family peptidase [Rhabdochlamydiaceae bacterium]|nr:S41 family peptidase [Candidatus Amphrikana amoebophyrae]
MKHLFFSVLSVLSILSASLGAKSLTLKDIHPISMQMLSFHVENNKLNSMIVKRAFKVYIDQFDPLRTYLLESEVNDYLNMSDRTANQIVARLNVRDYSDFEKLNTKMQKSVVRARKIRDSAFKTYENKGFVAVSSNPKPSKVFPKNITQLTQAIHTQMDLWIYIEQKSPHYDFYTENEKVNAYQIWERRQKKHENPYMFKDNKGMSMSVEEENHFFSQNYLKAFAKSLDAHTMFFSREEVNHMRMSLHKQFRGIGVMVRESGKGPFIADVVKGGPAFRSQRIHPGDLIVAIDGDRLNAVDFDQVLKKLEGKEFSKIVLTLKKPNADHEFDVVLRREKITMDDQRLKYSSEPYGDGIIGKISFDSFYDNGRGISTDQDMKKAILELRKQGNLKGVILDIRQNPGGFLTQAVKVAGLFIPKGIIAIAKYSNGEIQYSRDVDGRMYFDGPLVVLTSKGSASASEVIAQALQDYNAAVIVGDKVTYGKGTMQFQNITDPRAPHYFKITVGRYYTVSGRTPQLEGVKADIEVQSEYAPYNIGERYLPYPISRDHLGFSFTDPKNPLREISGADQSHLYSSFFPKSRLKWKAMIPQLKDNSEKRLAKDSNYQAFVEKIKALRLDPSKGHDVITGLNDLQMKEAVHIMRDMIAIDQLNQASQK